MYRLVNINKDCLYDAKRKVTKVNSTYFVSIPKEIAKKMGLDKESTFLELVGMDLFTRELHYKKVMMNEVMPV